MRKRLMLLLLLVHFSTVVPAQLVYSGTLNEMPVELTIRLFKSGEADALLSSKGSLDGIYMSGGFQNDSLALVSCPGRKGGYLHFLFTNVNFKTDSLSGYLLEKEAIRFQKQQGHSAFVATAWETRNSLERVPIPTVANQPTAVLGFSLAGKALEGEVCFRTSALLLYRNADSLPAQQLPFKAPYNSPEGVTIGDYNFDGYPDFAVDTSTEMKQKELVYFLYNPLSQRYFQSRFWGSNLEFDTSRKRIFREEKGRTGDQRAVFEYKIVNNEMVFLRRHCYIWNVRRQDWVKGKCR